MQDSLPWERSVVCSNGHPCHDPAVEWCATCGAAVLSACPGCHEPVSGGPVLPQFCSACGRPFPWTERAMSAARALIRELAVLDQFERDRLRRSIDHIIRETPQTPFAILRIRQTLARLDEDMARPLRELLASIASESLKQELLAK